MLPFIWLFSALGLMGIFVLVRATKMQRATHSAATPSSPTLLKVGARAIHDQVSFISTAFWGDGAARRVDLEGFDIDQIEPSLRRHRLSGGYVKRFLDIVLSAGLLLFMMPVLVLVAIGIKLDSTGTIFYRQQRVGLNGRIFHVIKFRTMVCDAEKNGAQWAAKNDCRVTRFGAFLRRTRIDEIPQAINVLKGEMSFVGPRPERPEFTAVLMQDIPYYDDRHMVKPGITGWAQVEYAYGASVDDAREKLTYDLYYIKNFSIAFDFIILLKTIRVTLFGIGSR